MRGKRGSRGILAVGAVLLSWTLTAAAAFAQSPYPGGGGNPPTVRGEKFFRGNEGFGRTGADLWLFILIALALLCLGLLVRLLTRASSRREA